MAPRATQRGSEPQRATGNTWRRLDGPFLEVTQTRQKYLDEVNAIGVEVTVELPKMSKPHPLVSIDRASRQSRRQTWTQRRMRYALPAAAVVNVELVGNQDRIDRLGLKLGTVGSA